MGILGVILAIIIIGIIIFIHEFGHYIMGKLSGCSVSQFSIGWGPKLLSFKRKETEYRISCVPFIGGYVRLPGMEGESAELTEEEKSDIKKYNLKTFEDARTWQKFLVFIGGVGLQIILCVLILTFIVSMLGKPIRRITIVDVKAGSPAEQVGLEKLDRILKVDGERIKSKEELIDLTAKKTDKKMVLLIKREGELRKITIIPEYSKEYGRTMMGINIAEFIDYEKEYMKWFDYAFGGLVFTYKLSVMMVRGIWQLITGQVSLRSVMGPVGIVAITKEVVKTGFVDTLLFFALININLAIINLLPFPALDGGHTLILSIERIFRVKIKPKTKGIINTVGFGLVILLMVYVTFNDVSRLVKPKGNGTEKPKKIEVQNK